MPVYTRKCNECDELFDVTCRIADKETTVHECPYCGATDGEYQISSPMFASRSDRLMGKDSDTGFKEVLQKIQSRHPRTEITKR